MARWSFIITLEHHLEQYLCSTISVINLYFFFIMIFKRGDDFGNEYGPVPAPNNRSVILLAWIFPAIMILGFVAAIALPAYQTNMVKARAAAPTQQR